MKKKKEPFRLTTTQVYSIVGLIVVLVAGNVFLLVTLNRQNSTPTRAATVTPTFSQEQMTGSATFAQQATVSPTSTRQVTASPTSAQRQGAAAATEEAVQWSEVTPPAGKIIASIELHITVEQRNSPALNCPLTTETSILYGTSSKICAKVINTGNVPLVRHEYRDNAFYARQPMTSDTYLMPGQSYQIFYGTEVTADQIIEGTWIAYTVSGRRANAEATATIIMERSVRPTLISSITPSPTLSPPTPTTQRRETIKVGQTLPHLPLTFETGEEMTLMDYQHTTMIVNFTATWCQPCLDMLPTMNDLQVAYTPEQLQVISVMSFDDEVDFAALRAKFPLAYPLAKADVTTLPDDYDIPAIPLTLIVSRDHIIRAVFLGSKDQATLEAALEEWMTTQ